MIAPWRRDRVRTQALAAVRAEEGAVAEARAPLPAAPRPAGDLVQPESDTLAPRVFLGCLTLALAMAALVAAWAAFR